MRPVVISLTLAAAVSGLSGVRAADWPTVPLPDDSAGESVSRHMLYNGLHMRTSRIRTSKTPAEVIAFYRQKWQGLMVEDHVAGKTILGHHEGDHYVTVDLRRAGGGTEATIGIMRVNQDGPRAAPGKWLARPANTEVLNDVQYLDTPGSTRTLTLRNRLSPAQNYEFYRRTLLAKGWKAEGPGCSVIANACAVQFTSSGHRLAMTIGREQDGTVIIANQDAR
jgi:hypothetical protein